MTETGTEKSPRINHEPLSNESPEAIGLLYDSINQGQGLLSRIMAHGIAGQKVPN